MIIKIETPKKKGGSIRDRLDYLLDRDPSTVSVLWRDLPESALIAYDKTIPRKVKYYRAIVGFTPEEYARLSKEDKQRLLDDLMEELFRGYKGGNRPPVHVVEHRDTSTVHWHVTIINDVAGKDSRFWFPKRDLKWLASVQDYLNRKYRLDNPRERIKDFKKCIYGRYQALFSQKPEHRKREYIRRELYNLVEDIIRYGHASNRDELIAWLEDRGLPVVRRGRHYITVKVGDLKIRLKGGRFHEGARYDSSSTAGTKDHSRQDREDIAELQRRIAEFGQRRFNTLGKVSAKVAVGLSHRGHTDRTSDGLEDVGNLLSSLRAYLSNRDRQRRKRLHSSSARALKEEKWRQLSNLATTREHEDLLQKTVKLTEELIEQLTRKTGVQLPRDLFNFKIEKETEYEKGGMAL